MFYNSQRITKSGIKELSEKNQISQEQNIINNKQRLIEIQNKEKMNNLLGIKYMRKCGIKRPQILLDNEINQIIRNDKLKKVDLEKINNKMKEYLEKQKPKRKLIISPKNIMTDNKLPDIEKPSVTKKNEKIIPHPIHSSLSSGNLKTTTSQPVYTPLSNNNEKENNKDNDDHNYNNNIANSPNTISSNITTRRKKKLYLKPEEELADLERELGLDEKAEKPKRGYERIFKFFSEGDEWEAINKYNRELYEKENEEKKQKIIFDKKKLREDLDNQIKEKLKKEYEESLEAQKYKKLFKEHNKQMEIIEKEKEEARYKKFLLERKVHEDQIKTKKIKERLEMLRQRKFDINTVNILKKQLEEEKKYLLDKKKKETEKIRKDMKETEKYMIKKMEKIKLQKEEDKNFCEDLEKTEIKKELERKKILNRVRSVGDYEKNENVQKIIAKIKKDEEEEDELLRAYLMKKKKIDDEKEENEKNRRLQMQYDLRKYLEIQIEEKKKEREFEKLLWKEQGKIWNIDSEMFNKEKKEINDRIKKMNLKNVENLKEQIRNKKEENMKKKSMSVVEYSLNKDTLNKIMDSMENKNKKC
jgi:hypothetical protein